MRTCMGGWCQAHRNTCDRYRPGENWRATSERLCPPGQRDYYLPSYELDKRTIKVVPINGKPEPLRG